MASNHKRVTEEELERWARPPVPHGIPRGECRWCGMRYADVLRLIRDLRECREGERSRLRAHLGEVARQQQEIVDAPVTRGGGKAKELRMLDAIRAYIAEEVDRG